jgi:hypothetical protein
VAARGSGSVELAEVSPAEDLLQRLKARSG